MQFVFNGTLEELKETISFKAKEHNKDILVYHNEPNTLKIGFQRLGHSGGRFFVSNITVQNGNVILDGETKNIFPNTRKSKIGYLWSEFTSYLFAYIILEIIILIPWIFLRNIASIWIPLGLPIIYLVIRNFLNRKEEKKDDKQFVDFMSMFTTYADTESEFYQPCWDDVYKRLDLVRGKLQSVCDDDEDMLLITYEDGMQIDVGYIEEDKTYYITVVSDDTMESWNNPLGVFTTKDKSNLAYELQKAIYNFRSM